MIVKARDFLVRDLVNMVSVFRMDGSQILLMTLLAEVVAPSVASTVIFESLEVIMDKSNARFSEYVVGHEARNRIYLRLRHILVH